MKLWKNKQTNKLYTVRRTPNGTLHHYEAIPYNHDGATIVSFSLNHLKKSFEQLDEKEG
jgi:hypothetical protein